jgi:two-component system response regulator MprA
MQQGARARGPLLIVDDDEDFRHSLAEALELEGWRVAEAADGAQALEWLSRNERPAAVLLDLWMPTMDGMQFRRAVEERSYGDLVIVLMTAARPSEVEPLDVCEVLEKPFTLPQLLAVLERHVSA